MDHAVSGGPGRVQVLLAADTAISQAQAAVAELQRLSALDPDWDWSRCLVRSPWNGATSTRCGASASWRGIPVQLASEEFTGVWRLRETRALLNWLNQREGDLVTGADLNGWVNSQPCLRGASGRKSRLGAGK